MSCSVNGKNHHQDNAEINISPHWMNFLCLWVQQSVLTEPIPYNGFHSVRVVLDIVRPNNSLQNVQFQYNYHKIKCSRHLYLLMIPFNNYNRLFYSLRDFDPQLWERKNLTTNC